MPQERGLRSYHGGTLISFREVPAFQSLPVPPSHTPKHTAEHIPRPPNAFMIFRSELCKRSSFQHQTTTSKEASMLWNALDRAERVKYYERADKAKAEHRERYPLYEYRPSKRGESRKQPRRRARRADTASGASDAGSSAAPSTVASSPEPEEPEFSFEDDVVQLLQRIVPPSAQELSEPTFCPDYTAPPPPNDSAGFAPRWSNIPEDFIGVNPRNFDPNHDGPFFAPSFASASGTFNANSGARGFDFNAWMAEP